MQKIVLILLFTIVSTSLSIAQDWQTDYNRALEIANSEEKPIILVFQGSDWCAPCMKLDREIWSSDVFKDYANDHYVMLQADFPRKKSNKLSDEQVESNKKLAEKYNKSGIFPLVVILDAEGKVLGQTGYKKSSPESYINELNAFTK